MSFVIPSWVKIALLVVGIITCIAFLVFLYLIIAGSDESRRNSEKLKDEDNHDGDEQIV